VSPVASLLNFLAPQSRSLAAISTFALVTLKQRNLCHGQLIPICRSLETSQDFIPPDQIISATALI
jgi:hypothetical protein